MSSQVLQSPWPSHVHLPRDFGMHDGMPWEIWWFVTRVRSGDRWRGLQVMFKKAGSGEMVANVAMADLESGEILWRTVVHDSGVHASDSHLQIASPEAQVSPAPEGGVALRGTVDDANGFELLIHLPAPMMHSAGNGCIPFHGGKSWQVSFPSVSVQGTVTLGGICSPVEGGGWIDRQWCDSDVDFASLGFTWFGLCLDNGVNISLWDLTPGDPTAAAWATIVEPTGAHTVVPVQPAQSSARGSRREQDGNAYPERWTITVPTADAQLAISHRRLFERPAQPFYQGVLETSGTWAGRQVGGYGFCDLVGWAG